MSRKRTSRISRAEKKGGTGREGKLLQWRVFQKKGNNIYLCHRRPSQGVSLSPPSSCTELGAPLCRAETPRKPRAHHSKHPLRAPPPHTWLPTPSTRRTRRPASYSWLLGGLHRHLPPSVHLNQVPAGVGRGDGAKGRRFVWLVLCYRVFSWVCDLMCHLMPDPGDLQLVRCWIFYCWTRGQVAQPPPTPSPPPPSSERASPALRDTSHQPKRGAMMSDGAAGSKLLSGLNKRVCRPPQNRNQQHPRKPTNDPPAPPTQKNVSGGAPCTHQR